MPKLLLTCLALSVPLIAAEGARVFPLWDGKETVERYAARVNLPATKSIDLGGGVKLDLVLIPAGQFIMGSAEPEKPTVTVAGANWMIGLGTGAVVLLLTVLLIQSIRKPKLSFSLRWLLLLTTAVGVWIGGFARLVIAQRQAAPYATQLAEYKAFPADEKPAHSVTLSRPFYMGRYTVTQAQYAAVMGNNPSDFLGPQQPVEKLSWNDATTFCARVNGILLEKTVESRLPTEAEWEYACRAGTQTRFYSGDQESDLDTVAWYFNNSKPRPQLAGQKKANAFGLNDMHGNVWQLCQDWYDETYYSSSPTHDPKGPPNGVYCVARGGYWASDSAFCRSAARGHENPMTRSFAVGFRIVLALAR